MTKRGDRDAVVLSAAVRPFMKAGVTNMTIAELGRDPVKQVLDESGVPFKDIEMCYVGHVMTSPAQNWSIITQFGLTGIPVLGVESACSSSTNALFRAASDISFGVYDVVLVIGVEKMEKGLAPLPASAMWPVAPGQPLVPAGAGLSMTKYMKKYGATYDDFCKATVLERNNASLTPWALWQNKMSLEEVKAGRMIAYPCNVYMCCSNADGASAAIVVSKEKAKKYTRKPTVTVAGWTGGNPRFTRGSGEEKRLAEMAKECYEITGIGPKDIGVIQIHNPFTATEVMISEALGFIPEGQAARWYAEGKTSIGGELPINTDGGLVGCGHPLGATGIRMFNELRLQLTGQAGARQMARKAKAALHMNMGVGGLAAGIYKI